MSKLHGASNERKYRGKDLAEAFDDVDGLEDFPGFADAAQLEAWLIAEVLPALEESEKHPERLLDAETVKRSVMARLKRRDRAAKT